jgi:hypothetical protein
MESIATLPGKSRLRRTLAVTLFLSCLALQPGFSEPASIAPQNTIVETPLSGPSPFYKPFSKIAVGVNFGSLGPAIQAVTPLTRRTNLRFDGSFFNYNLSLTQNGVQYNGSLEIRNARASYDFYPFGGSFRISAGAALYNQLNLGANGSVSPGNTVTLNDVDYYSSATNPMHGSASFAYGRKVAPTLTLGWGNAIPRSGRHFAFPFEFGAAFTGTPTVNLNFAGSACTSPTDSTTCGNVTTFDGFQSNLAAQRQKIVNDVAPLRVYPILNMGVSYRF